MCARFSTICYIPSILHYLHQSLNVFFHFYEDDTQFYMTVDDSFESQEKLTCIYEALSHWVKKNLN